MAGDPDLQTTEKALLALDEEGADVIELGVPYSVSFYSNLTYCIVITRLLNYLPPLSTDRMQDKADLEHAKHRLV